jgi:hypothetical protein
MPDSSLRTRELHARKVCDLLDGPTSGRWAVVQTERFLRTLSPKGTEAEAYVLPMADPLAQRAASLNPVGLAPAPLARLVGVLQRLRRHHPVLRDHDAVQRAEMDLRRRAALLYAYGGAVGRAVEVLAPEMAEADSPDLSGAHPRARLRAAQRAYEKTAVAGALQWLTEHWALPEPDANGVCMPVVERLPAWATPPRQSAPCIGALRALTLSLHGRAEDEDVVRAHVDVHGAEATDMFGAPVRAARRCLAKRFSEVAGRYVEGHLTVDRARLPHEGASAGMAVVALFCRAVLQQVPSRCRLHIRPEALFTGAVTDDGAVQPVDREAMATKVRTAFFSPKSRLVVPAMQEEAAAAVRDDLLEAYPHGALEVVGTEHIDILFYDRRLTRLHRTGGVRYAAQQLWMRRRAVSATVLIGVLLAVIGALLYGPVDTDPVSVAFDGAEMALQNQSGAVIDRLTVGPAVVRTAHADKNPYDAYDLYDITGDGRNEVCWAQRPAGRTAAALKIRCRAVGASSPLWTTALDVEFDFPEKPAVEPDNFSPRGLLVEDADANGRPEVYLTAAHQPYFPGVVVQLDAVTGAQKQQYVNAGHLNVGPVAMDLDQDDRPKEVLVGGTSNAYSQGVLIALDPRSMDGHGPVTEEYRLAEMDPAAERAYLRFPYTRVGQVQQASTPSVFRIRTRPGNGGIRLRVRDGTFRPERADARPYVLVHLTRALRAETVGTSTEYDLLAEALVAADRLDTVPGADDFARYRDRIRYWTGTGWSTEPVLNQAWRRALRSNPHPDTDKLGQVPSGARDSLPLPAPGSTKEGAQ